MIQQCEMVSGFKVGKKCIKYEIAIVDYFTFIMKMSDWWSKHLSNVKLIILVGYYRIIDKQNSLM